MIKKIILGLLALIVAVTAIFLAPAILKPTLTNESRVTINKPREEVWKKFMDSSKMGEWLIGFKSIEPVSGEPNKVGSKYKITIEENGEQMEAFETVKEIVENEKFAFELANDMVSDDIIVTFVNRGLTTEVVQSETINAKGIVWKALFYWMQSTITKRSQENLNNLKKYIEGN